MKLYKENEIPDRPVVLICRESRLVHYAYLLAMLVFTVIFLAIIFNHSDFSDISKIFDPLGIIVGCCFAPIILLIVIITAESLIASYKSSNWMLKVYEDGLLIKFRSYLNYHFNDDDPCVVYIPKSEIISINKTIKQPSDSSNEELSSDIKKQKIKAENSQYIDIVVNSGDVGDLKEAIKNEIALPPQKKAFSKFKSNHYPVKVLDGGVIRLDWKTTRSSLRPKLDEVLRILAEHYNVEDDVFENSSFITKNDVEFNKMVKDKAISGDKIAAIKMIRDHYGYNLTRAKAFLDELLSE